MAIIETRRMIRTEAARQWPPFLFIVGSIGMAAAFLVSGSPSYSSRAMSTFGLTAVAVTCTSVVLFGIQNSGTAHLGSRILRSPILTQCGKYSYAMYIFQLPIRGILPLRAMYGRIPYLDGFVFSLLSILLGVSLSYLAARCSWVLVEQRFLKLKGNFPTE
jgi:peptidoglycan/LPS O-acetylase OafA/YrhL